MSSNEYFGHCLCKQVCFYITGTVRGLCYCHCESCRRLSGVPFVAWGTVDLLNFQLTAGVLTLVNSAINVERGFCGNCDSSLTYKHANRNTEIDFTLASLGIASALVPKCHIWVQDKLRWITIDDGLPQYQTVAKAADI